MLSTPPLIGHGESLTGPAPITASTPSRPVTTAAPYHAAVRACPRGLEAGGAVDVMRCLGERYADEVRPASANQGG